MEKLIYATWRPQDMDSATYSELLRGQVTTDLTQAGAHGVQINVFDDEVADAQVNRSPWGEQLGAVINVWVDSARDEIRLPIEAVLRGVREDLAGWLVTESMPLIPPTVALGERSPGLSNMAFVYRRPDLEQAQFIDRWQNHHTTVAIDTQSTFGYVQNAVVRPVTEGAFEVGAIVEELFPIEAKTDQHVFFDTGGSDDELARRRKEMADSCDAFLDNSQTGVLPSSRYVMTTPFAR